MRDSDGGEGVDVGNGSGFRRTWTLAEHGWRASGRRGGGPQVLGLPFVEIRSWKELVTWSGGETEPRSRVVGTAGGFLDVRRWQPREGQELLVGGGVGGCRRQGVLVGLLPDRWGLSRGWTL